MTEKVVVVGIGADGWDGLTSVARHAISACDVLLGSCRQLDLVPAGDHERVPWPSPLLPALAGLFEGYADRKLCVLASGDPMFHGIGVSLAKLLGPQRLHVIPQPSSASLACARLAWPLAETPVVSLVNRQVETLLPALMDDARLLVLSNNGQTPAEVAHLLSANGYGRSVLRVLEQLGGPSERQLDAVAVEWAHHRVDALNIIAIECIADPTAIRLTRGPGLPDHVYGGDGQLTKSEMRALSVAALAPAPGELLWDVGGGSGSIAIEWSRSHPRCRAIAFERKADRSEQILANARALGVPTVRVLGAAPAALGEAETPNAIFVGGGLTDSGLLDECWSRLPAGGRLVANSVTAESDSVLLDWAGRHGGSLRRFQIYRAEPLGRFTSWRPHLPVTQWCVSK
ncbi:precorrin-6y C5,15-methyltransferase (decarboxylating) subunit CbiE [Antrihabitans cavernicola]|uniref:Precorrin-6y C5,15-methyltransferase (Decarboxylating) subunit CbiE n=1 Tax=Antrihabitans cavernicola TaxID=2495913 RepID=A0A5A7S729_9NOCA|nr:precorrin-6y C5,15-methyltransferase (decarboxylating) subunit CbiE [Spelaeibacter cavernicola]KAA0021304.1 precorrin-6y C5,15-methyltransferase (decarboxylating) subunit CbiE [Spelaeibacter cavernicola]